MEWFQIAQGTAAVVTILMAVAIGPLFRLLSTIKNNHLHHIDTKIDANHKVVIGKIDGLSKSVDDIGGKLQRHLEAHAEGRFK